ncbi:MAG: sensor histidine kinase [Gaiella sp.]
MSIPGGIRGKFALSLVVIVGGALASAYLLVVPSLEQRLVDGRLERLRDDVALAAANVERGIGEGTLDDVAASFAETFGERLSVFGVLGPPVVLTPLTQGANALTGDEIALRAVTTGRIAQGVVTRQGVRLAEAAVLLEGIDVVVLVSAPLADSQATIALVERRLLIAGVAAGLIALGVGSILAGFHAVRIRRLERAANRIEGGDFDEPVLDHGRDEVGQLAAAFDRMRVHLARLDVARREFVANASHELRTPLFALGGFLELLADEDLDEETRARFLSTTREQVARLQRLAGDLLDLSRMDMGRLRVVVEEVDLNEVTRVIVEELSPLAAAGGRTIGVEPSSETHADADEERVLQVIRALAGNALVHTHAGATVSVRTVREGSRVGIAVEDDGPGVSREHVEHVFERFYRAEGGTASGSGLGLAIAKELAERMRGEVRLTTEPGRTVFTLLLPAAAASIGTPARQ